jgi:hypothetical protein
MQSMSNKKKSVWLVLTRNCYFVITAIKVNSMFLKGILWNNKAEKTWQHRWGGAEHGVRRVKQEMHTIDLEIGHAMWLVAGFPLWPPRFKPRSGHVGFVVDKEALGQLFSDYFCFPYQSFHLLLHTHHHPPSGAGTVGQTVADVQADSVSPHPKTRCEVRKLL